MQTARTKAPAIPTPIRTGAAGPTVRCHTRPSALCGSGRPGTGRNTEGTSHRSRTKIKITETKTKRSLAAMTMSRGPGHPKSGARCRSSLSLQPPISLAPDVSDPLVGHRGVDNGVGDRAMAHEGLQGPRIDSTSRQGVASRMPEHVGMDREWQLSGHAKPFNQLLRAID